MKIYITFFVVLISAISFSQVLNDTVYFRDGSIKVGYVIAGTNTNSFYYQKDKTARKVKYDYKTVKKLTKVRKNYTENLVYKINNDGNSKPILLEQFKKGKVYLYSHSFLATSSFGDGAGGSFTMTSDGIEYYVCRDDNDFVVKFKGGGFGIEKSFRERATDFFKDCPYIVEKIKNGEWKRKNTPEIVDYYNENCAQ